MTSWPPFPREIEADPAVTRLRARLEADAAPLWSASQTIVPCLRADAALTAVLAGAARAGQVVIGLEGAGAALDREEAGLAVQASRDGRERARRISRVLLLASDGAERFYRGADAVMRRHGARLLACRLDLTADALGRVVVGRPASVKAVLVQHKVAVSGLLRAIAGAGA